MSKADKLIDAIEGLTSKWHKQRRTEERDRSAKLRRRDAMTRPSRVTARDVAFRVMKAAYLKASAGGTLPANARQIMYAARPAIQDATGKTLRSNYFTQTLLPDYIEMYEPDWDVVFDARGRMTEPHTKTEVQLGTLAVRKYLNIIGRFEVGEPDYGIRETFYPTAGPINRYGAILFIEKEGFAPLFEKVNLAQRYDIAIMSTKGMSVTASRELVQAMSIKYGIPVYVLHDFDISGFTIFGTLSKSTRRFRYITRPKVYDLGLRWDDIDGLDSEDVEIDHSSKVARKLTLQRHGATAEEIEFLMDQRVELNALPSDELVALIEEKLDEHGVTKLIPSESVLVDAYRRMKTQVRVQAEIDKLIKSLHTDDSLAVPDNLDEQVRDLLEDDPELSWDRALIRIIQRQAA